MFCVYLCVCVVFFSLLFQTQTIKKIPIADFFCRTQHTIGCYLFCFFSHMHTHTQWVLSNIKYAHSFDWIKYLPWTNILKILSRDKVNHILTSLEAVNQTNISTKYIFGDTNRMFTNFFAQNIYTFIRRKRQKVLLPHAPTIIIKIKEQTTINVCIVNV